MFASCMDDDSLLKRLAIKAEPFAWAPFSLPLSVLSAGDSYFKKATRKTLVWLTAGAMALSYTFNSIYNLDVSTRHVSETTTKVVSYSDQNLGWSWDLLNVFFNFDSNIRLYHELADDPLYTQVRVELGDSVSGMLVFSEDYQLVKEEYFLNGTKVSGMGVSRDVKNLVGKEVSDNWYRVIEEKQLDQD